MRGSWEKQVFGLALQQNGTQSSNFEVAQPYWVRVSASPEAAGTLRVVTVDVRFVSLAIEVGWYIAVTIVLYSRQNNSEY